MGHSTWATYLPRLRLPTPVQLGCTSAHFKQPLAAMKRSIRFAEQLYVKHEGAVLDVDGVESTELWFQNAELKQVKQRAMALSREAGQLGLNSLLTNTYGRTDADTIDAIISWGLRCGARRGLERFADRDYSLKRSDIRSRTIKSVLKAQKKLRQDGVKDVEYVSIVIGRLSEAFSREAVQTARALGDADQAAAAAYSEGHLQPSMHSDCDRRNQMERTYSPANVMDIARVDLDAPSSSKATDVSKHPPHSRFSKASNAQARGMNENLLFC
jgi:hypothetical protein